MNLIKICKNYGFILKEFFSREINQKFVGSAGGKLWLILNPLSQIIIYTLLFSVILKIKLNMKFTGTQSFLIFLLSGMFLWLIFSEAVFRGISIIIENANLITKVAFPNEILPIVAVLQSFFINGIGLGLFLIFLIFRGFLNINWFFLPFIIIIFFMFVYGFVLIFSSISVFIRDIQHLINILLFVWFYSTPIIYPGYMIPDRLKFVLYINPLNSFISVFRSVILNVNFNYYHVFLSIFWSLFLYYLGNFIFQKLKLNFSDVL